MCGMITLLENNDNSGGLEDCIVNMSNGKVKRISYL